MQGSSLTHDGFQDRADDRGCIVAGHRGLLFARASAGTEARHKQSRQVREFLKVDCTPRIRYIAAFFQIVRSNSRTYAISEWNGLLQSFRFDAVRHPGLLSICATATVENCLIIAVAATYFFFVSSLAP